jgi:hypothetical protein
MVKKNIRFFYLLLRERPWWNSKTSSKSLFVIRVLSKTIFNSLLSSVFKKSVNSNMQKTLEDFCVKSIGMSLM